MFRFKNIDSEGNVLPEDQSSILSLGGAGLNDATDANRLSVLGVTNQSNEKRSEFHSGLGEGSFADFADKNH